MNCLNFSHECAGFRRFNREWLKGFQQSGEWYGELYFGENLGFLVVDENKKASFFVRKTPYLLSPEIELTDLPANSVFEVGRFFTDKMFLIFYDILIHNGKRLALNRLSRLKLLKSLVDINETVLRPLQIDFWLNEYSLMLEDKGTLGKKSALRYGIPHDEFLPLVKGLVVKNKKSFLSFPEKFQFSDEAFYLTLAHDKKYGFSNNK